jgi:hypothetical protein
MTNKCAHCGDIIDENSEDAFEESGDWFCNSHHFNLNENFLSNQDASDRKYAREEC